MDLKKAGALALSAVLLAAPAWADGFGVYEWSARGVGMGGAMMFSDEASLMAYNPAGLTRLKNAEKGQISGAITYIAPRGEANFYDDDGNQFLRQHNKNDPAFVPTLFYARKVDSNLWFGLGLYPRFGLKASYDPGWYGRFSNRSADLVTYSLASTFAWKLTPTLSMGVTAEAMYAGLELTKSAHFLGETPFDVDGDDWGYGWGIGLDWQATRKLSLAFLYRSEVKQHLQGDVNLYSAYGTIGTSGDGVVHLPESFTFGLGWQFDDKTRAEFDAIKTMWSSYEDLTINLKVPSAYSALFGGLSSYPLSEEKHWRNGWRYQFGLEHQLNDRWTLRCGFVFDECSSNLSEYADYMVPTGIRRTYTIGASYRVKNVEYAFAYGYMTVDDKTIKGAGVNGEDSRTSNSDSHIISIGARIDL